MPTVKDISARLKKTAEMCIRGIYIEQREDHIERFTGVYSL